MRRLGISCMLAQKGRTEKDAGACWAGQQCSDLVWLEACRHRQHLPMVSPSFHINTPLSASFLTGN